MVENFRKRNIIKIIIPIIIVIVIIGISYAAWVILRTQESTNIVESLKCFGITFEDETDAISFENDYAMINEDGMARNPYSFTITNSCTTTVAVDIALEVLNTTTIDHQYMRASLNDEGNIIDESKILTDYTLGTATIDGATSYHFKSKMELEGSASKTYDLRLWIDADTPMALGMNKTFKSKIVITAIPIEAIVEVPCYNCLNNKILAQEVGGATAIEAKGNPDYSVIATVEDTGVYATEDEYGTSYYYRGLTNYLNNNLIFAGFQWKIVRINGDGSIRLIYNGKESEFNTYQIMNSIGTVTQAGTSQFSSVYNNNRYVGYMYGSSVVDYNTTHANEINSTIKTAMDTWYENNILNQGSEITSKIVDNIYCVERQIVTGTGFGSTATSYAAYTRLQVDIIPSPTLKCVQQNDRFTVTDTTIGNGALNYPVGLISADEASMAGLKYNVANTGNYLYTGQNYWTSSPANFSPYAYVGYISSTSAISKQYVDAVYALRPVLNLSPETEVTGSGNIYDPFKAVVE